jgi:SHNi-TPR.
MDTKSQNDSTEITPPTDPESLDQSKEQEEEEKEEEVQNDDNDDHNDNVLDNEENAADIALLASKPLTYFNTKHGPFYTKAKEILQTDDFDLALSKIETGLTATLSLLTDRDELHESLAPLYYMYGTTLLYSVEESQTTTEASIMGQGAEDAASDLQYAWENLETARRILSEMKCTNEPKGEEEEKERVLDLAQIHCRLADLSRHNGHYEQAIRDYEACCEGRRSQLVGEELWDRRIADVEYSLGMTCLLLAAEGEKNLMNEDGENKDGNNQVAKSALASMTTAAKQGGNDGQNDDGDSDQQEMHKVHLSPEEISALRDKSLCHYVQCARILAGIIATRMGGDPHETCAADASLESYSWNTKKLSSKTPQDAKEENLSVQQKASKALESIRERVSKLLQDPKECEAEAGEMHDLSEMLDEIQETIDNCEQDREGLKDVNRMRKMAEEEIQKADAFDGVGAAVVGVDKNEGEKGVTTIGFGSSSVVDATTAGVGSVGGMASNGNGTTESNVAVMPMMVVKKKKKVAPAMDAPTDAKKLKIGE